jgi:predicted DNA binding CopG/RHH family protein
MKRANLSRREKEIESALLRGEYRPVGRKEFENIAQAVARRKKDAVLSIRVNREDLEGIKQKARHLGIPYQSFVSELIHQYSV